MTQKQYLESLELRGQVKISKIISGDQPVIRLEKTWFHPQGGGQKSDRGRIGSCRVLHVAHNGAFVDHFVDGIENFEVGMIYDFQIDVEWRHLNSVYHTAGHLVASVVEGMSPSLQAISGHQWPGEGRIEFIRNGDHLVNFDIADVNARLADCIDHNLNVSIVGDPYSDREVVIGDFCAIPCGGTHIRSLAQVRSIQVTKCKKSGKKFKVSYDVVPAHT